MHYIVHLKKQHTLTQTINKNISYSTTLLITCQFLWIPPFQMLSMCRYTNETKLVIEMDLTCGLKTMFQAKYFDVVKSIKWFPEPAGTSFFVKGRLTVGYLYLFIYMDDLIRGRTQQLKNKKPE